MWGVSMVYEKDFICSYHRKILNNTKKIIKKIKELDEVYCLNYHYFNKQDLNNFNSCFYTVRFL